MERKCEHPTCEVCIEKIVCCNCWMPGRGHLGTQVKSGQTIEVWDLEDDGGTSEVSTVDLDESPPPWRPVQKKPIPIQVAEINRMFAVETYDPVDGRSSGRPGDYLARDAKGNLFIIEQEVMQAAFDPFIPGIEPSSQFSVLTLFEAVREQLGNLHRDLETLKADREQDRGFLLDLARAVVSRYGGGVADQLTQNYDFLTAADAVDFAAHVAQTPDGPTSPATGRGGGPSARGDQYPPLSLEEIESDPNLSMASKNDGLGDVPSPFLTKEEQQTYKETRVLPKGKGMDVCPLCSGGGKLAGGDCDHCQGLGWVKK